MLGGGTTQRIFDMKKEDRAPKKLMGNQPVLLKPKSVSVHDT